MKMKRIVHAQRTTQKLMAALKSDGQFKDEILISKMESEIKEIEPVYNSMVTDLQQSPSTAKYIVEIDRIWEALNKSHTNSKTFGEMIKENLATISKFNMKITAAGDANESDQKVIGNLQQEVQRALRMVDTAHAREQVAQETVENLRQQITRLNQQLEQKSKSVDQDGEYSSIAKNKEALMKEREKMVHEISVLKEKLLSSIEYQEELEKKNSQADLKVAELTQELENQTNEMSREARFKERFEDDLLQVKKELVDKESEITYLNSQILEYQRSLSQLQNVLKDQKNMVDRLNQNIDSHQQRIIKLIEDLQKESAVVEDYNQKIIVLSKQMKFKDEIIAKLTADLTKTSKLQESLKTKFNRMEIIKNEVVEQRDKLQAEIENLQKQIHRDKHDLDVEKRKVENMIREKENVNKSALKTAGMLDEQLQIVRIQEQEKFTLEQELESNRKELSQKVQELLALEKENERHISENVVLKKKVEAAEEDIKLKQSEIQNYKKKLDELETQLTNKCNQCELVRYDLNTCSKNLLEARNDILDLNQKEKVITLQIEQLKDDIAGKETQLIREQLALRKAHGEKESMRVEIQKCQEQLDKAKEEIVRLNLESETLQNIVKKADVDKERDAKEKEKIMTEKDILSNQLVSRNDEIALLQEKVKIFQSTMDKEQLHYEQRMEDIRLLKLEVKKLCNEKQLLTKSLENMVDLRSEVHHLEKNLTKERLKSRALQEEQQNPLNIHRWRKLESSDPDSYELVQKVRKQQRRILSQTDAILQLEDKYNNLEKQYQSLVASKQPLSDDFVELQRDIKVKDNKIKGLTAMLSMREVQAAEYKMEIDKLNQELTDNKKKFYDQKQKAEKLGQKLKTSKIVKPEITISPSKFINGSEMSTNNKNGLPVLSQKPRFIGGGFNMGIADT